MPLDRSFNAPEAQNSKLPWDLGPEKEEPGVLDVLGAAFRTENEVGVYFASKVGDLTEDEFDRVDFEFNPFDHDIPEGFEDKFVEVTNYTQYEAVKADIERELRDNATLDAAGWGGTGARILAGFASPTSLAPGGAVIKSGRLGYRILRSAASIGAASGIGAGVQQAALYKLQQTRTGEDVAIAVGGSVVLGSLLGSGGALLSKAEFKTFSRALEEDAKHDAHGLADGTTPSDLKVGGSRAVRGLARITAMSGGAPNLMVMHAQSDEAKRIGLKLVNTHVATAGQLEGRTPGASVEASLREYGARRAHFVQALKQSYKDASRAEPAVGRNRFNETVYQAFRNGGVDRNGNKFVEQAAQTLTGKVIDPAMKLMVKTGLLPEGVSPALVSRVVSKNKVLARTGEFRQIVRNWVSDRLELALIQGRRSADRLPTGEAMDGQMPGADGLIEARDLHTNAGKDAYVGEVVDSIIGNVSGRAPFDGPDWSMPVAHGPLKGQLFDIPDALIDDFLEHDAEVIADVFTRKIAPEIELTRAFGSADMKRAFSDLKVDYDRLIRKAGSGEERLSLQGEYERVAKTLADFRDILRNNYRIEETTSVWGTATKAALAWNNARLGGGRVLKNLTNVALVVTRQGTAAFMQDAMPALVSKTKAARIAKQDAREFVTILDTVTSARLASLADLNNPLTRRSTVEALIKNFDERFSRLSGINWWNGVMKDAISVQTMNRIAKNILDASDESAAVIGRAGSRMDYGKLSRHWRGYMGKLGISEEIAGKIGDQIGKHGLQEHGIWGLNLGKWEDAEARSAILAAIHKEVDGTLAMGGVGEMPLWARSNLGKIVMQFKSQALTAHQNILIARLQGRPKHLAELLLMGTSIGMLSVYLERIMHGDFEGAKRLTENPGGWIAAGLDRSKILSVLMTASNAAEELGSPYGIKTGAQALAGDKDQGTESSLRGTGEGSWSTLFGPTIGQAADLATIARDISNGGLSEEGADAAISSVPGNTLPGVSGVLKTQVKPVLQGE